MCTRVTGSFQTSRCDINTGINAEAPPPLPLTLSPSPPSLSISVYLYHHLSPPICHFWAFSPLFILSYFLRRGSHDLLCGSSNISAHSAQREGQANESHPRGRAFQEVMSDHCAQPELFINVRRRFEDIWGAGSGAAPVSARRFCRIRWVNVTDGHHRLLTLARS